MCKKRYIFLLFIVLFLLVINYAEVNIIKDTYVMKICEAQDLKKDDTTSKMSWELTDDEIKKVIELAKSYRKNPYVLKNWIVGDMETGKTYITVVTPALMVYLSALDLLTKYIEPDINEIKRTLEVIKNSLAIYTQVYGDKIDFAKDYYCVIRIGDKIIHPYYKQTKEIAERTENWPYSPAYEAMNIYLFSTMEIPRDAKIEVIIIKGLLDEEVFKVDLSQIP
jgi:hypothetical protein